jgi:putative FmdB family regulatory protein
MPTYEYRCNACKREFEVQQRMADDELTHCTACHQDKLEKLISWTTVRSDVWKEALYADKPEHAMKGTHAVDLVKPPKSTGPSSPSPSASESFKPCGPACERTAAAEGLTSKS